MEVVVSAAVLVLVVLGVLAALDAISSTAGANRARTVAATLAEKDQERLRGMTTVSISGYSDTRTVHAAGADYTVVSKAEWIRDATGETVSCTSQEGQVNYLRISSTVTSPATGGRLKPVVISSLVAPPAGSAGTQGTLAVSVKNAAGLPVMALPVVLSGAAARVGTTNQEGCAVFSLIPAGTYAVTLNQSGWVDRAFHAVSTKQGVTVTAGNVSTVAMEYDRAASVTVQVETLKAGATAPVPDASKSVVASNSGIQPSGFQVFTTPTEMSTINVGGLFPFTDAYTFYSGACSGNDPSLYVPGYFDSNPGSVQLGPGAQGGTIKVREPAINLRVTRGGNQQNAPLWSDQRWSRAKIYPTAAGCEGTDPLVYAPLVNGGLAMPGVPFGKYAICVDDRSFNRRRTITGINNDDPRGTPQIDLWIDTSSRGERGSCDDWTP